MASAMSWSYYYIPDASGDGADVTIYPFLDTLCEEKIAIHKHELRQADIVRYAKANNPLSSSIADDQNMIKDANESLEERTKEMEALENCDSTQEEVKAKAKGITDLNGLITETTTKRDAKKETLEKDKAAEKNEKKRKESDRESEAKAKSERQRGC
ncbi:MAG: hypothetical protein M1820_003114 [Bogoriella megaspora]|nr:MAG: hypothetical protein M1820_003114 [Bogoriella megaspora]